MLPLLWQPCALHGPDRPQSTDRVTWSLRLVWLPWGYPDELITSSVIVPERFTASAILSRNVVCVRLMLLRIWEILGSNTDSEKSVFTVSCIASVAPAKFGDGICDWASLLYVTAPLMHYIFGNPIFRRHWNHLYEQYTDVRMTVVWLSCVLVSVVTSSFFPGVKAVRAWGWPWDY